MNNQASIFAGGTSFPFYDQAISTWIKNGDCLNMQYTDTESNISWVTKQEE